MEMGGGGGMGGWMGQAISDFREDRSDVNSAYAAGKAREHYVEDTNRAQWFEREKMMNANQWKVKDLEAAGLNPILAAGQPASMAGSGNASYQSSQTFKGGGSTVAANAMAGLASARNAAEIGLLEAGADKQRAEAETERNRPENVRADTGVKREQAEKLRQDIDESIQRIDKMSYEMEHLAASADVQRASANKVREETRHVEQLVESVKQSNKANLPEVQRRVKEIEEILLNYKKPEAFNNASLHESYLGRLSTLLKGLSPLIR